MNKIIKIILGIFVLFFIVGLLGSGGNNSNNSASNQVQEPATTSDPSASTNSNSSVATSSGGDNKSNENTSNQVQEPATTSDSTSDSTAATNSEASTEASTETYKVGDRVVVGDRAYTVTNIRTASSVGTEYTKKEATGIFVIVTMTIENVGKESATISSSDVKIIDSDGRTFESDSNAWIYLKDNILLKQIQPGLPITGETIFDVPKGVTCNLQVSGGGWGTDNKLISLGTIQ